MEKSTFYLRIAQIIKQRKGEGQNLHLSIEIYFWMLVHALTTVYIPQIKNITGTHIFHYCSECRRQRNCLPHCMASVSKVCVLISEGGRIQVRWNTSRIQPVPVRFFIWMFWTFPVPIFWQKKTANKQKEQSSASEDLPLTVGSGG